MYSSSPWIEVAVVLLVGDRALDRVLPKRALRLALGARERDGLLDPGRDDREAEAWPACPHSPSVSPLFFTSVVKPLIRSCAACSCSTTLCVKLVFVSALNWAIASFMNLPESAKDAMDHGHRGRIGPPAGGSERARGERLARGLDRDANRADAARDELTEFHVARSTSTSAPKVTAPMAAQSVIGMPMSIRNLSPLRSPSSRIWRSAAVTAETAGTNCPLRAPHAIHGRKGAAP
jgi:hypothetical protein